jgi:hypothetical protein
VLSGANSIGDPPAPLGKLSESTVVGLPVDFWCLLVV